MVYTSPMFEMSLAVVVAGITLLAVIVLIFVVVAMGRRQNDNPELLATLLEEKHLGMIRDLNAGLNNLGDRLNASQADLFDRLRNTITQELSQTRSTVGALQVSQVEELSAMRESTALKLAELSADLQSRQDQMRAEILTRIDLSPVSPFCTVGVKARATHRPGGPGRGRGRPPEHSNTPTAGRVAHPGAPEV